MSYNFQYSSSSKKKSNDQFILSFTLPGSIIQPEHEHHHQERHISQKYFIQKYQQWMKVYTNIYKIENIEKFNGKEICEFFQKGMEHNDLIHNQDFQRMLGISIITKEKKKEKKGLKFLLKKSNSSGIGNDLMKKIIESNDGYKGKHYNLWSHDDFLLWLNDLNLNEMVEKLKSDRSCIAKNMVKNFFFKALMVEGMVESCNKCSLMRDYKKELYIMKSEFERMKKNSKKRYVKREEISIYDVEIKKWDAFHMIKWLEIINLNGSMFEDFIFKNFIYGKELKDNLLINEEFTEWEGERTIEIDKNIFHYESIIKEKLEKLKSLSNKEQILKDEENIKLYQKRQHEYQSLESRKNNSVCEHISYVHGRKMIEEPFYRMLERVDKIIGQEIEKQERLSISNMFDLADHFTNQQLFIDTKLKGYLQKFVDPKMTKLPIKLILTNIKSKTTWKAFLVKMFGLIKPKEVKFGYFHAILMIGNIFIEWDDSEIVYPKILDFYISKDEKVLEKDAVIAAEVGNLLEDVVKEKERKKIVEKLMNVVAEVCVTYNREKSYEPTSCNCQHFVDYALKTLSENFKYSSFNLFDKDGAMKNFISRLKSTGKSDMYFKPITAEGKKLFFNEEFPDTGFKFETHDQIDRFYKANAHYLTRKEYSEEMQLLKAFDRSMWLKHFQNTSDPKYQPFNNDSDQCPFMDPRKS